MLYDCNRSSHQLCSLSANVNGKIFCHDRSWRHETYQAIYPIITVFQVENKSRNLAFCSFKNKLQWLFSLFQISQNDSLCASRYSGLISVFFTNQPFGIFRHFNFPYLM